MRPLVRWLFVYAAFSQTAFVDAAFSQMAFNHVAFLTVANMQEYHILNTTVATSLPHDFVILSN